MADEESASSKIAGSDEGNRRQLLAHKNIPVRNAWEKLPCVLSPNHIAKNISFETSYEIVSLAKKKSDRIIYLLDKVIIPTLQKRKVNILSEEKAEIATEIHSILHNYIAHSKLNDKVVDFAYTQKGLDNLLLAINTVFASNKYEDSTPYINKEISEITAPLFSMECKLDDDWERLCQLIDVLEEEIQPRKRATSLSLTKKELSAKIKQAQEAYFPNFICFKPIAFKPLMLAENFKRSAPVHFIKAKKIPAFYTLFTEELRSIDIQLQCAIPKDNLDDENQLLQLLQKIISTLIDPQYSTKDTVEKLYIHQAQYDAFKRLIDKPKKEKIRQFIIHFLRVALISSSSPSSSSSSSSEEINTPEAYASRLLEIFDRVFIDSIKQVLSINDTPPLSPKSPRRTPFHSKKTSSDPTFESETGSTFRLFGRSLSQKGPFPSSLKIDVEPASDSEEAYTSSPSAKKGRTGGYFVDFSKLSFPPAEDENLTPTSAKKTPSSARTPRGLSPYFANSASDRTPSPPPQDENTTIPENKTPLSGPGG